MMPNKYSLAVISLAAAAALQMPAVQAAFTVDFAVDGVPTMVLANQGQPGDKITLLAYSDSLSLVAGVPTVAKINSLVFEVNYTWPQGIFTFDASRNMTMTGGGQQLISQSGTFDSWLTYNPADAVTLNAGSPITFNFGASGTVVVTPLAAGPFVHGDLGTYTHDITASFLYTPVPEASTLLGGALLFAPLGLAVIRRARKH